MKIHYEYFSRNIIIRSVPYMRGNELKIIAEPIGWNSPKGGGKLPPPFQFKLKAGIS